MKQATCTPMLDLPLLPLALALALAFGAFAFLAAAAALGFAAGSAALTFGAGSVDEELFAKGTSFWPFFLFSPSCSLLVALHCWSTGVMR